MWRSLQSLLGWGAVILGIVVGVAVWRMLPAYLVGQEQIGTVVEDVRSVPVPGDKTEYALEVRAQILVSSNCQRLTHYALVEPVSKMVFPLGQTVSGAGFAPPWKSTYNVMLSIPPTIKPGKYLMAVRSIYSCTWFGIFSTTVSEEIERIPVDIK